MLVSTESTVNSRVDCSYVRIKAYPGCAWVRACTRTHARTHAPLLHAMQLMVRIDRGEEQFYCLIMKSDTAAIVTAS